MARFGDLVSRVNTKEDRFNTDKVYYVGGEHIESNELSIHAKGIIEGSTIGPMFYFGFKAGDILFVTRNPHLRKAAMVEFDGICSEKTLVLATNDNSILLQNYLAIVMQSDDFWEYCEDNKSGGVNYFINWSTLEEYEFDLPPIDEQKKIASQVWAAYRLKEAYKRLLVATDEMMKSQFIEMFGNSTQFVKKKVHDLFCLSMGKTPSRINSSYWDQDGYEWASISDMGTWDKYVGKTAEHISMEAVSSTGIKPVPKNTIIMSFKLSIGRTCITTSELYTNEAIMAFLPLTDAYDLDYLHFYIANFNWNNGAKQAVKGATLNKESIGNSFFILPPKELQEEFADIVRQADKSKFDGFKSQFIEMFGTVENNLHQYSVKTIGDIAECFAGATPSTSISEYWENGTIRWMSSGEVHNGHIHDTESRITELGYRKASTKMVPLHSVVIALAGQGKTRGTVAVTEVELCTNQSLCAIVPNGKVHYEYLYHNLNGRYIELRGMSGDVNGRGGLNLRIIQSIPIIVPPFELQQQFADIVNQADKSKYYVQNKLNYICHILTKQIPLRRCS